MSALPGCCHAAILDVETPLMGLLSEVATNICPKSIKAFPS